MNNPNVSTFLTTKFIAIDKYQQACADRDAFAQQVRETIKALGECVKRRNDAEAILTKLKFQRQENGVWIEL